MNHGALEDDELTFRGLERRRTGASKRIKFHQNMVRRRVIASSNKQRLDVDVVDDDNDDVLGEMCQSLTLSSTVEALDRATKDTQEIADRSLVLIEVSLRSTTWSAPVHAEREVEFGCCSTSYMAPPPQAITSS